MTSACVAAVIVIVPPFFHGVFWSAPGLFATDHVPTYGSAAEERPLAETAPRRRRRTPARRRDVRRSTYALSHLATKRSSLELLAQTLVDHARIRLAARLLHHLSDQEAEQALLAGAVGGRLLLVGGDDLVDHRVELGFVRDERLPEVVLGLEAGLCAGAQRLDEGVAGDP